MVVYVIQLYCIPSNWKPLASNAPAHTTKTTRSSQFSHPMQKKPHPSHKSTPPHHANTVKSTCPPIPCL